MRILQIITLSELGGAQTVVSSLSNALVKLGHRVTVMSDVGGRMWTALDQRVDRVPCADFKREVDPVHDFRALRAIREIIKAETPDIIHLHSSKAGALGRLALIPHGSRIVYTVHGFDSILKANKKFLFIEKILRTMAGKIVPVSAYDQRNMAAQGFKNTIVVENASLDMGGSRRRDVELESIRRRFAFIVMCVARVGPQKRDDLFKGIASALAREGAGFVWIGNKLPVDDAPPNCFFLGERDNAGELIHYADAFLLPSNYEGLPISILEALSCSVPVVASSVGAIPDILDGCNGFACENAINAFADRLAMLMKDDASRGKIRLAARTTWERRFALDSMVDGYLKVYESAIKGEASHDAK